MHPFAEIWHGRAEDVLNVFSDHGVLPEEELVRRDNFLFEKDRKAFLAAHLLKRNMLSKFAKIAPNEWLFKKGPYGRPEIKEGLIDKQLYFNISHSRSVVCCLVSNIPECGVDIEDHSRKVNWKEVGKEVFTKQELIYCDSDDQRSRNLWCLKESYIKAKGMGFNLNPISFNFIIDKDLIILQDKPDWKFSLNYVKNDYTIACALHSSLQIEVKFTKLN